MRRRRKFTIAAVVLAVCIAGGLFAHWKYGDRPRTSGDANQVEARIEWRGMDSNYATTTVYRGDNSTADQRK